MKPFKRKTILTGAAVLCVCAAICAVCLQTLKPEQRLTQEEIEALRDDYPICYTQAPPHIDLVPADIAEIRERTETFVYGEITGSWETFTHNGYARCGYPMKVIGDTENLMMQGRQITLYINLEFQDYYPSLCEGMRVVVPVVRDLNDPTSCSFSLSGMYYVTPDDYVLSCYDESLNDASGLSYSGISVEALLRELKK